jgi:hypothetical protein
VKDEGRPEWMSLESVLANLSAKNLLPRCTSIKVGGIEIAMLPAAPEAALDERRRERAIEREDEENLFGSA